MREERGRRRRRGRRGSRGSRCRAAMPRRRVLSRLGIMDLRRRPSYNNDLTRSRPVDEAFVRLLFNKTHLLESHYIYIYI